MDRIELNKILNNARKADEIDELQSERRIKECMLSEYERRINAANALLDGITREATIEDYQEWLKGYLEKGGQVTHVYNYPMKRWVWKVVLADFKISPLYGSESLNLIVPKGIKCLGGNPGHTAIYYMDNYLTKDLVPIFSDINF